MRKFLMAFTGIVAIAGAAVAAPVAKHTAKAKPAAKLVCPVTGETVASVKDSAGSSTYKGKKYFFCCAGCKPMFDKEPAKYTKSASAKTGSSTMHHM